MNLGFDIAPLHWQGIASCLLCGALLGIERQWRGKPVGIRTASLIIIGTYTFMSLGMSLSDQRGDHARVLAQIITGIGFLGAGVMMTQNEKIIGVTSAASVWLLAALGVLIAVGYGTTALVLTGVILFILVGVDRVEASVRALRKGVHRHVEVQRAKRRLPQHEQDKIQE
ncbi:MgtC/SapB family protein [Thaumasiovibrio subtropicus]|uniref:MgtC/SapB family protein n=1 Tax=Thaumasiovibrio subtropicus TaxID=1891207 RepID=UPI000B35E0CF|nr:MgtC/SapB family protein [Thaumasiovibrio subtropicus]